jgi:hypothetical protein
VSQHNKSGILVSFPYFKTKGKVMVASHLGADPFMLPVTNIQTVHRFSLN